MARRHVYRVIFQSQGRVYEVYARSVQQSALLGFLEIERLLFGEKSTVVVDPTEEQLKNEFAGVARSYIPIHAIIRIDEVEKQGAGRITTATGAGDNVRLFPVLTRPDA